MVSPSGFVVLLLAVVLGRAAGRADVVFFGGGGGGGGNGGGGNPGNDVGNGGGDSNGNGNGGGSSKNGGGDNGGSKDSGGSGGGGDVPATARRVGKFGSASYAVELDSDQAPPPVSYVKCGWPMNVQLFGDSTESSGEVFQFSSNGACKEGAASEGGAYVGETADGKTHVTLVPIAPSEVGDAVPESADLFAASVTDDATGTVWTILPDEFGTLTVIERNQEDYPPELDPPNEDDPPSDEDDFSFEVEPFDDVPVDPLPGFLRGLSAQRDEADSRDSSDVGVAAEPALPEPDTWIDALVLWTPTAAREAAANRGSIESVVRLAVEETNAAYKLSGVKVELRLAHMQQTSYDGDTSSGSLSDLRNNVVPNAHGLREQYKADVVALITSQGGYCGVAYLGPSKNNMFSVAAWNCATGYYSFGHEIGHNMGCNHDRGTKKDCSSTDSRFGYRDPQANFRSILAYNCASGQCDNNAGGGCTRVQRFSNPNWSYGGRAIGSDREDNRKRINSVRRTVAGYYDGPPPPSPPSPPTPQPTPAFAPAVIYQAEDANTDGIGSKPVSGNGASGDMFIDMAGKDSYVEFGNVNGGPSGSPCKLIFRYAIGTAGDRPAMISMNGVDLDTLNFKLTGGWNFWDDKVIEGATCAAGRNIVRLTASTSAGGPNVDYMKVEMGTPSPTVPPTPEPTPKPTTPFPTKSPSISPTKSPTAPPTPEPTASPTTASPTTSPTPPPTMSPTVRPTQGPTLAPVSVTTYYTTDATFGSSQIESNHAGAISPEGKFINMGGQNSWVEWPNVDGGRGGDCKLSIRYAQGSSSAGRPSKITVNGDDVGSMQFQLTGGWNMWKNNTIETLCSPGTNNAVRMRAETSTGGPNVDALEVRLSESGPTKSPTALPTKSPTLAPTLGPTANPTTGSPTSPPTKSPTPSPTVPPTSEPSKSPSFPPTISPTKSPSVSPTLHPTVPPTPEPTNYPSSSPTGVPTKSPSIPPSTSPTVPPTPEPTEYPTHSPTVSPSKSPSFTPTLSPTAPPTPGPTENPSRSPTDSPTKTPSISPTLSPTVPPTPQPTPAPVSVTTYYTRDATFESSQINSNHDGAISPKGEFINMGGINSWVEWPNVDGGRGGDCKLLILYAQGSSSARPSEITVNGVYVGSMQFQLTGRWDLWDSNTIDATCSPGTNNAIRMRAETRAGGPNVDALEVTLSEFGPVDLAALPTVSPTAPPTPEPTKNPSPSPTDIPTKTPSISPTLSPSVPPTPQPTPAPVSVTDYQTRDATFDASSQIDSNHAGAISPGGEFINMGGQNSWVEWPNVDGGAGGDCKLLIRYAQGSSSARPSQIMVNGVYVGSMQFQLTGGWNMWKNNTIDTTCSPGNTNVIRMRAKTSAGGPNVDNLKVAVSLMPSITWTSPFRDPLPQMHVNWTSSFVKPHDGPV